MCVSLLRAASEAVALLEERFVLLLERGDVLLELAEAQRQALHLRLEARLGRRDGALRLAARQLELLGQLLELGVLGGEARLEERLLRLRLLDGVLLLLQQALVQRRQIGHLLLQLGVATRLERGDSLCGLQLEPQKLRVAALVLERLVLLGDERLELADLRDGRLELRLQFGAKRLLVRQLVARL